jgi:hypothetical protein
MVFPSDKILFFALYNGPKNRGAPYTSGSNEENEMNTRTIVAC